MTTSTILSTLVGHTEVPLLAAEQLTIGVLLGGPAWQRVYRVLGVQRGTHVLLAPATLTIPPDHTHIFNLQQQTACACGARRKRINGKAPEGILAVAGNPARTVVFVPTGSITTPDTWTRYVNSAGQIYNVKDGMWLTQTVVFLPVIPRLRPVWTVPERLRALLATRTP